MTSTEFGKWWMRGLCCASVLVLAGCLGGGGGDSDPDPDFGPDIIVDPGDEDDDDEDDEDDEDPIDIIPDILTDILTTGVTSTTLTSAGGS